MTVTRSRLNEEVSGHQKRIPVYNPVQGKSVLPQSSEALRSGLTMSGSKRNNFCKFEFKGRQKIFGWKWRFWFKIRFKGKISPTKLWSSQYPVQDPGSRRIYLLQKVKSCRRGPVAMMYGSNMGIPPYWLIILLITWGLQLRKQSSVH